MKNKVVVDLDGNILTESQIPLHSYVTIKSSEGKASRGVGRLKRMTLNQFHIKNMLRSASKRLNIDSQNRLYNKNRRTSMGGKYYLSMVEYSDECLSKGRQCDGLPCYKCESIILEGERCISMPKGNGSRKYYHELCAEIVNII